MIESRTPILVLSREEYELFDSEAKVFLDEELLGRFERLEHLSPHDIEDFCDFRNYMFGFSPGSPRGLTRRILNFLINRDYYRQYYEDD